ncbi:uncharacterized protein LOC116250405 [Nymphaea colorata]|uniref:uncharacterized protein LOC116250405 n=1 Tax=Nymphaea colorata TaxID=210225 RepID=UPI00129EDB00|nr:uncharacterized protein LOC116250405 [Nymphaea colorata]
MGEAVVIVLSFVLLLALLLLFILAELYYTLVLKSRLRLPTAAPTAVPLVPAADSPPRAEIPLSSSPTALEDVPKLFPNGLYAPGVFTNPGFLFSIKEETLMEEDPESPCSFPTNLHFIGLLHPSKAATTVTAAADRTSPSLPVPARANSSGDGGFVCISNPIYEVSVTISNDTTPFETPVSSPSKLDGVESPPYSLPLLAAEAGEDVITPPLTPMKLPLMASSVHLADKSLVSSSCSDCSSSESVCTSPSW